MNNGKYNNKLLGSGVLLAFTSSLCCLIPLLALSSTASSAVSVFSWMTPLRPYLLLVTVLVLALAFYRTYRPAVKDDCGCEEKKSFMQSKSFLWIVTLISIGLSAFPYYASYFQKGKTMPIVVNNVTYQRITMHIEGMSCAACEGHINSVLQKKHGVKEVTTSYAMGQSIIKFDSTQISSTQLATAVEKETGYKVTNVKDHVN